MTTTQERWDVTFAKLDRICPVRRADESETNYLRRLSRIGRKYIPTGEDIAQVRFDHTLPDAVVPKFSELMRAAVERNVYRTDNMEPGTVRPVMKVDEQTGLKIREWVGPESFVRNPLYGHRDCRRVVRITRPAAVSMYESAAMKRAASGSW
jgi:hypothetical protein